MNHLPEALQRMAENDPSIERIQRIPVGTVVVYRGRHGSMRQGRTEFPALVLKQHEDDGTLDMIVFYEAEDMIWEQRVRPYSEVQPGHCWTMVEGSSTFEADRLIDTLEKQIERNAALIRELKHQMYGDYEAPPQSMIEYLDGFDKRLQKLEKTLRK